MPLRLDRAFLRVSGPDALGFLDNLLTQDVTKLDDAGVLYSALLTPQGKVVVDMFLWAEKDKPEPGVLIECDPSRGTELLRRLNLYKLRAKVSIEDATAGMRAFYSSEPLAADTPDPRLPDSALGFREFGTIDVPLTGEGDALLEHNRIALGVPDLARDAQPEEVFAGEALLEELNGVAFDKGCFVGQENVSRMKRRATTRKKFCPIAFEGEAPPYGTAIKAGDAEIGTVRTGVRGRAIALLRLDRALETTTMGTPLTADGQEIRLDPPPWLILPQREDRLS
jgi:folate-binding protein YgfZ